LPAGDFQYPLAAITAIISWQFIGWPASSSTRMAASKALGFWVFRSFAFLVFDFAGVGVAATASVCSTGVAVPALVVLLDLSLVVVLFVAMRDRWRARFVFTGPRTICVAPAGSVIYPAGRETTRQFAAEFGRFVWAQHAQPRDYHSGGAPVVVRLGHQQC